MRPDPAGLRRVLVVGTGLIGTSVALALTGRGVDVLLEDLDPDRSHLAAALGAGRPYAPVDGPIDHAVLAVPPSRVPAALQRVLRVGVPSASDVASVKAGVVRAARALGCDLTAFAGGHPVAGRERGGPAAARADLFVGRPWVLTPTADTAAATLDAATRVARLCGAVPVVMTAEQHDEALAVVSHAPQLVASALAGLLVDAPATTVALAGQGLRDLTRIAASDVALWSEIAAGNAAPLAEALDRLAATLRAAATGLRGGTDEAVAEVLRAGNVGHARLPGKHSRPAAAYAVVPVVVPDEPGRLARLFADAAESAVNIEDLTVEHAPGAPVGVIELAVVPAGAGALASTLQARGWSVHPIVPPGPA